MGLHPRIEALKRQRADRFVLGETSLRDECYRQAFREHPEASRVKQFAYGFERFVSRKSISVDPADLLAGFAFRYSYNTTFPATGPEDFDPTQKGPFAMDMAREVVDVCEELRLPEDDPLRADLAAFSDGMECWLFKHWHSGHFLAGYDRILNMGFGGILAEEDEELDRLRQARGEEGSRADAESADSGNEGRIDAVEAFRIVTASCIAYIERYAERAGALAREAADEDTRRRMARIAESAARVAAGRPESFFDAVQLLWLAFELTLCESYPSSVSVGRFDAWLAPYYERDVAAGVLTEDEALLLVEAFWIKLSTSVNSYQNLVLGGTNAQGRPCAGPLTLLCLRATEELRFDQPSLTFRWTEGLPDELWDAVLRVIRTGTGFPALFGDECCVAAKISCGIPEEEARGFAFVGCAEICVPGKEYVLTELARLNLPKVLELMLHQGRDPKTGKVFPLHDARPPEALAAIRDFDEFYRWYLEEMRHFIELGIRCTDAFDAMYARRYPLPFLSSTMADCVSRGADVSAGGARYNGIAFNIGGFATAVDSLLAVKTLVFEKGMVDLPGLARALDEDFAGHEALKAAAERRCPKYGNDDEAADALALDLAGRFIDAVEAHRTPRGGAYRVGLYTVEDHAIMGAATGATPDGRGAGESLSNSFSPVQGRDVEGPTALLNTVNRFDFSRATNGMVLDMKFTPTFLESEEHRRALREMIETYFARGGMELQISVVSKDTLIAAQERPEDYADLVVRVSGFSAYFTTLRKVTQDEIIRRTEIA